MQIAAARDERAAEPGVVRKPRRSVAQVIRFFGLIFLAGMVGLLAAVGWWSYASAIREAENTARSLTLLAANQVARMVESADLLLTDMWRIARVADWKDPRVALLAGKELEILAKQLPHVARLMIYGPDGTLRVASDPGPGWWSDVARKDFFTTHRTGDDRLYISPVLPGEGAGGEIVISRRVVGSGGAFDGIVAVAIKPDAFGAFYRSLHVEDASIFQLIHADMSLLVREPPVPAAQRDGVGPDLRREIRQGSPGPFTVTSRDGVERIADVRRVEDYPLYVSVGLSRAAVSERWMRAASPYFLFSAIALIGLVLLTQTAVRRARREDHFRIALLRANAALEDRVRERTHSLAEALEAKDTLFKELNHRVKNNLQIVSSLLQLQAGKFSDPAVIDGFQSCLGRIRSMSAVHEQLYRKDHLVHVDFGDYLRLLCGRLAESYGAGDRIRLDVQAESDILDMRTTVPLALFVNEAVSNSFKHAFPDGRSGTISIDYARDGDRRRLEIRDDGVGVRPDAGSAGSLGLKLAQSLAHQIGGTLRQEPADPGTRIELLFTPQEDEDEPTGREPPQGDDGEPA